MKIFIFAMSLVFVMPYAIMAQREQIDTVLAIQQIRSGLKDTSIIQVQKVGRAYQISQINYDSGGNILTDISVPMTKAGIIDRINNLKANLDDQIAGIDRQIMASQRRRAVVVRERDRLIAELSIIENQR